MELEPLPAKQFSEGGKSRRFLRRPQRLPWGVAPPVAPYMQAAGLYQCAQAFHEETPSLKAET